MHFRTDYETEDEQQQHPVKERKVATHLELIVDSACICALPPDRLQILMSLLVVVSLYAYSRMHVLARAHVCKKDKSLLSLSLVLRLSRIPCPEAYRGIPSKLRRACGR